MELIRGRNGKRKLTEREEQILISMYKSNHTMNEIAERLSLHWATPRVMLIRLGVYKMKRRPHRRRRAIA